MGASATEVHNFNPDDHPPAFPVYSHISTVNISPTAKLVSIAGQAGKDNTPFGNQVRDALAKVDLCLSAAGADKSCIVSVRQYIVKMLSRDPDDLPTRNRVYMDWWKSTEGTRAPPPSTLVGVDSLGRKGIEYEIDVTCVVGI
ncbi:Endoribonuclease L-PSP/chorismate mutase-like protein [Neohortaea acidophila]|uniref:Endoribonuclease L-PSP/chorismate mutase-like protein n=1 Tax=Neohortaea acidophila TaxID=245834 RepID=A0A6A6Q018_9PEZI|nr:Endoribonuclease L-PSP/chorismate mutase-like protein [Neohortaea acidophila]KAF2485740.1 Endoribonuclease L-PSP/chorismate mutase-like protein [Neohortaea acidophila]